MTDERFLDQSAIFFTIRAITPFLSKRTAVYLEGVGQLTNNGANAVINGTFEASSSRSQFIGRIGMQTMF